LAIHRRSDQSIIASSLAFGQFVYVLNILSRGRKGNRDNKRNGDVAALLSAKAAIP
jgi:hypothetical protein